jgi:hypothetical protein
MTTNYFPRYLPLLSLLICLAGTAFAQPKIDLSQYQKDTGITVVADNPDTLRLLWPAGTNRSAQIIFDLRDGQPLIRSLGVSGPGGQIRPVAGGIDPVTALTIGERDKQKAEEGYEQMVFFEKIYERPHQTFLVTLTNRNVRVVSDASRVTVGIGGVSAGSFNGEMRFTFFAGSPLIKSEVVVSTHEKLRAILYDSGFSSATPDWTNSRTPAWTSFTSRNFIRAGLPHRKPPIA